MSDTQLRNLASNQELKNIHPPYELNQVEEIHNQAFGIFEFDK